MLCKLFYSFFSERRLLEVAKKEEYTSAHGSIQEFEDRTRERNSIFRKDILRSLRDITLMLLISAGLSCLILQRSANPIFVAFVFIFVGGVIAAFATLGRVGWSIQTLEGNTIVEQLNGYWFRLLYRVSVTMLFTAGFVKLALRVLQ